MKRIFSFTHVCYRGLAKKRLRLEVPGTPAKTAMLKYNFSTGC
jgi:hypothetical protein